MKKLSRHSYGWLAMVGIALLAPKSSYSAGLATGQYHFEATYSAVCLNGIYPLTVGDMTTDCALEAKVDASGNLIGTLDLRTLKGPITGTLQAEKGGIMLQLATSGQDVTHIPSQINAKLHGGLFEGTATTQNGTVPSTLDVTSVSPLVVSFDLNLNVNNTGAVSGAGTASNCVVTVPVQVTGNTNGITSTLHVVGVGLPNFIWNGSGPSNSNGFLANWTATGFGASASGANLQIFAPSPNLRAGMQRVLADLNTLRGAAPKPDQGKLDEAIKQLTGSVDPKLWVDPTHLAQKSGEKVFEGEKNAVNKLRELINDKKSSLSKATLQTEIDGLVVVARQLAQIAINEAVRRNAKRNEIRNAQAEFSKAEAERSNGKADSAIDHYKNAWSHAIKA